MNSETLKISIIDRVKKIEDKSILVKLEELVTQAEMEDRAEESLRAIREGNVLTLEEFRQKNEEWWKNHSKS